MFMEATEAAAAAASPPALFGGIGIGSAGSGAGCTCRSERRRCPSGDAHCRSPTSDK